MLKVIRGSSEDSLSVSDHPVSPNCLLTVELRMASIV